MLQIRGEPDLTQEAFGAEGRGQLRSQYFDRDLPPVLEILGKVDHRHPTATELALNRVATGEGGLESVEDLLQVS